MLDPIDRWDRDRSQPDSLVQADIGPPEDLSPGTEAGQDLAAIDWAAGDFEPPEDSAWLDLAGDDLVADLPPEPDAGEDVWAGEDITPIFTTCEVGETASCYGGPAGTNGVGECHAGSWTCIAGDPENYWGACQNQVLPGPEICDGLDNDCDGKVDNLTWETDFNDGAPNDVEIVAADGEVSFSSGNAIVEVQGDGTEAGLRKSFGGSCHCSAAEISAKIFIESWDSLCSAVTLELEGGALIEVQPTAVKITAAGGDLDTRSISQVPTGTWVLIKFFRGAAISVIEIGEERLTTSLAIPATLGSATWGLRASCQTAEPAVVHLDTVGFRLEPPE